jgi:LPS-assembly protein
MFLALFKHPFCRAIAVVIGFFSGASKGDVLLSSTIDESLDWRPITEVTDEKKNLRCRQCRGTFLDPWADQTATAPGSANVKVTANESNGNSGRLNFQGDVSVVQGNRLLQADSVQLDRNEQLTTADGNIGYREPGVALLGDRFVYDSKTDQAQVTNAQFVLHQNQMRGTSKNLERHASGHIDIDEGAITFCAPDNPEWFLKGNEIHIDPANGMAKVRHATLEWGDIPIFYLPWITFPIDDQRKRRHTNFLFAMDHLPH